ncbi:MAG: acyl-CoA dehydrogenase [Oscillibacter sp.]|jgi:butyryl-CoA dehydrogenase|nr:acyl-CoA dehydrogenase [Oscillibacter sp.]
MDFKQDESHQDILEMVHDFAVNEVKPLAAEIDKTEEFPMENVKKMAEMGLLGIPFPEEYGGSDMDTLAYIQTVEELSKYCATTGVIVSAHTSLCCTPIYTFGSEEQKQKYLPKLCSGEWLGAFALTEPNAGTDASGQKTVAVDKGDHWVLNGSKIFITNAGAADVFFVLAMTDKSKGNRGISAFIVEKGFKGFSIGKQEDKMGIRASSTCELVFEDCIVPKENLVGELGKGFKYAMATLDGGRIGIAAQALGIAEGAIEETVKYVQERKQFGKRLSEFQNTQFELAQMRANTEAAKLLVYQAACAKDDHENFSCKAAMAKLVAARNASDVTRRCLQLYGGYGYTKDYPIERMMRDAKITEIYEGTSEVQMMVISSWMGVK